MPSFAASISIFGRRFLSLVDWNPWNWVTLIYIVQTLGALIVIRLFGLNLAEVAPAIILLILAASVAIVFRWYDPSSRLGPWKWWIPAGLYALFIFSLSSKSYPEARTLFSTKLFHPVEYLTLGIFLSAACHKFSRHHGTSFFILSVQILGILYAISDEFHQAFVPGRTARLSDVFIDSVSVALGCGIFLVVRHARKSRVDGRVPQPLKTEVDESRSRCEPTHPSAE
jgi:VanZ family protein